MVSGLSMEIKEKSQSFSKVTEEDEISQVRCEDEILRGIYATNVQVAHTKEEFIIDFMNLFPPTAIMNARVIVSPGHMKRMLDALTENVKRYEDEHGSV
jgi:hypothetical protein